jgi:hypothetical protein
MSNLTHLTQYLFEALANKKQFNIDDELQKYNIEKRETSLKTILENNPLGIEGLSFELYKKDYDSFLRLIKNLDNIYFKELIVNQINLINDYKALWAQKLDDDFKNVRGKNRERLHRELLINEFLPLLQQERNFKININEELNICYLENEVEFATKLSDILESIEALHINKQTLFFRGHDNASYRLIPSIYRDNAPFYEKEIFYDTISTIPQEVNGVHSAFEILTKFQHFGTPTRLLDITTNPLVALFFACKGSTKDGELLVFSVENQDIKLFDSDTVSVVTNLVKLPYDFHIDCSSSKNNFNELVHKIRNEKPYFENLIRCDDLKKSFFVKPKLDNPRIIKQSGAFIVCGMEDIKYLPSKEIYDIEKNKVIKRIIIPRNLKKKINNSLDVFNISSGSLFPELSDVARYVKNRYGVR